MSLQLTLVKPKVAKVIYDTTGCVSKLNPNLIRSINYSVALLSFVVVVLAAAVVVAADYSVEPVEPGESVVIACSP